MMTHYKMIGMAQRQSHQRGFTLMEIMIVVAIIGLLAGLAFPSYMDYLRKSRRSDARSLLMQIVSKEEQYFMDNRTYTNDFQNLGYPNSASVTSENNFYTVTFATFGNYAYKLTATPINQQASDTCTTLTIDNNGTKEFTPTTAKQCW